MSDVEVSPAMIEAGLYAVREYPLVPDWREVVTAVYQAMEYQRRSDANKTGFPEPSI